MKVCQKKPREDNLFPRIRESLELGITSDLDPRFSTKIHINFGPYINEGFYQPTEIVQQNIVLNGQ